MRLKLTDLYLAMTNEVCHEKTDLKVFVVVIPKEGWARMAAHDIIDYILEKSVSYQKKDGRAWPRPSFFWYDTDFSRI